VSKSGRWGVEKETSIIKLKKKSNRISEALDSIRDKQSNVQNLRSSNAAINMDH
jgi:hypothetical protein